MSTAWAHLHLPRLKAGETPDVISLKIPGERIDYVSWVELDAPTFKVSEPGRQRAIREGVRNVHAWVVGDVIGEGRGKALAWSLDLRRAIYDPWKGGTFVDAETFEPVLSAARAVLVGKTVYYV